MLHAQSSESECLSFQKKDDDYNRNCHIDALMCLWYMGLFVTTRFLILPILMLVRSWILLIFRLLV